MELRVSTMYIVNWIDMGRCYIGVAVCPHKIKCIGIANTRRHRQWQFETHRIKNNEKLAIFCGKNLFIDWWLVNFGVLDSLLFTSIFLLVHLNPWGWNWNKWLPFYKAKHKKQQFLSPMGSFDNVFCSYFCCFSFVWLYLVCFTM